MGLGDLVSLLEQVDITHDFDSTLRRNMKISSELAKTFKILVGMFRAWKKAV